MASCPQPSQPPASTNPAPLDDERTRHERRIAAYPDRTLPGPHGRRRLTIPVTYTPGGPIPGTQNMIAPSGRTSPQTLSPLFRLSGELRNMVYGFLVDHCAFHILVDEAAKTLGHLACPGIACRLKRDGEIYVPQCVVGKPMINSAGMRSNFEGTGHNLLPMLQTCRQIYTEFIGYLYKDHRFAFSDLYTFRLFYKYTIWHHVDRITCIYISQSYKWSERDPFNLTTTCYYCPNGHFVDAYPSPRDEISWHMTWQILSGMPHLKRLIVDLVRERWIGFKFPAYGSAEATSLAEYVQGFHEEEGHFFKPLSEVSKKVPRFYCFVNWPGYSHPTEIPDEALIRPFRGRKSLFG